MKRIFKIENRLGLHARPASLFVQMSALFKSAVRVTKDVNGEIVEVNGKSVMGLMLLAAAHGEEITVTIEGKDEQDAMKSFEDLFMRKFDEE